VIDDLLVEVGRPNWSRLTFATPRSTIESDAASTIRQRVS
jgi:hypothetical protein